MLSPTNTGPTAGGKLVNITGTNFTGATAVKFGTTNATSFAVNSSTSIAATSPSGTASNCPGSSCAPVDVTVTTPNGTSVVSTADQFVYANPPTAQATVQLNTNTSGGFVNGATLGFRQVATFTGTSDNGAWNNPASLSTTTALASNGSNGLNNLTLLTSSGSPTISVSSGVMTAKNASNSSVAAFYLPTANLAMEWQSEITVNTLSSNSADFVRIGFTDTGSANQVYAQVNGSGAYVVNQVASGSTTQIQSGTISGYTAGTKIALGTFVDTTNATTSGLVTGVKVQLQWLLPGQTNYGSASRVQATGYTATSTTFLHGQHAFFYTSQSTNTAIGVSNFRYGVPSGPNAVYLAPIKDMATGAPLLGPDGHSVYVVTENSNAYGGAYILRMDINTLAVTELGVFLTKEYPVGNNNFPPIPKAMGGMGMIGWDSKTGNFVLSVYTQYSITDFTRIWYAASGTSTNWLLPNSGNIVPGVYVLPMTTFPTSVVPTNVTTDAEPEVLHIGNQYQLQVNQGSPGHTVGNPLTYQMPQVFTISDSSGIASLNGTWSRLFARDPMITGITAFWDDGYFAQVGGHFLVGAASTCFSAATGGEWIADIGTPASIGGSGAFIGNIWNSTTGATTFPNQPSCVYLHPVGLPGEASTFNGTTWSGPTKYMIWDLHGNIWLADQRWNQIEYQWIEK